MPIAGWYPDPTDAAVQRYWDGSAWTAQTRPNQPPPFAPPPPGYPGPAPAQFAYPPAGAAYPAQPVVAAKNPAVSLVVSVFLPGVGSMINGDVGTGVAILVIWIVGAILAIFVVGVFIALGAWIWGLVDAYKGAQRWNARHGIIS